MILLGGGGHGRVLLDLLGLRGVSVLGITDPDPDGVAKRVLGVRVLGSDTAVLSYDPSEVLLINGLGGARDTSARRRLFTSFIARGYTFGALVHPQAIVAGSVLLGEGVQIMAGAVVQTGVELGENTVVNTRASVDHDCVIAPHVHIAPGATLSGDVRVEDGAHIGVGATVMEGITIGARAVIGAGAVVIRDVPADTTVVGVPARPLRTEQP